MRLMDLSLLNFIITGSGIMEENAPGFRAESILRGATIVIPDPQGHEGFFKYLYNDWEMIFNPSTKIVAHLSPIAPSKRKLI
jgi:hypothetical protein